jgi:meso-butanediol dehydrogenase/(S,S)-butanediol dehydrogenase/diacetyl reductase
MIEQRSGCIINTTSAQAILAVEGFSAYGSAKAAVITISRVAALENARYGIRVNALCPGSVQSRSWDQYADTLDVDDYVAQIPQRRVGRSEELADAALFLASPMASYVNGTVLIVDGGMSARTSLPRASPRKPKPA